MFQLVDLHIYIVPDEKWLETRRLAKNQVVDDAVSIGFIRVLPELSIHNLRREMRLQLGPDLCPANFVFLRSVGRNFTQVKSKQEHQLKAKNFMPPCAAEPEIYLLDIQQMMLPPLPLEQDAMQLLETNRKSNAEERKEPSHTSPPHPNDMPCLATSDAPLVKQTPSPSPPAAPSSEDSGISASPRPSPNPAPSIATPTSPHPNLCDEAKQTFDVQATHFSVDEAKRNGSASSSKKTPSNTSPRVSTGPKYSGDAIFQVVDDNCSEMSVTFVIVEQEEGGGMCATGTSQIKEKFLMELTEVVHERKEAERRKYILVEKAKELQHRVRVKREKNQQVLREQLISAKKESMPLEEACAALRLELDDAHRHLLETLDEREIPLRMKDGPSKKANYKITAARLQHEIKDLQQKVKSAKLRHDTEMKLRSQAEREVRQLREDLSQKKSAVSTLRSQMLGPLAMDRMTRTRLCKS